MVIILTFLGALAFFVVFHHVYSAKKPANYFSPHLRELSLWAQLFSMTLNYSHHFLMQKVTTTTTRVDSQFCFKFLNAPAIYQPVGKNWPR